MSLNFLFMDDSYSPVTKVSSLTGVVVPVSKYPDVRAAFYDLLRTDIRPQENVIAPAPVLHGREFLPGKPDEKKLEVLTGVASLVVSNGLRIYRIGYFITPPLERLSPDRRLIGWCWFSLVSMMEPLLKDEMLIPVMDGFGEHTVRSLSGVIKSCDEMRSVGRESILSLRHTGGILGEVFYANSKYSVLTQVADIVSYLRAASDLADLKKPLTPFKRQLADISATLQPAIVWEEVISLILNGKAQGPPEKVRPLYRTYGPITQIADITPSDTEDIIWPNEPTI